MPSPDDRDCRSSRRYRALLDLAAMDKSDFDSALRRILETDAQVLDIERVNCWVLEREPEAIRCCAGYVRASGIFESGTVLRARDYPHYFTALADAPIVLADDARTDPRTSEFSESYLKPYDITAMMDVPIWVRGKLWGVVCHEHVGSPRSWSEPERDFAMSIGHIVSMAVEGRDRAEAERVARFSEFFVGALSHDLRNPLTIIRASAEHLLTRAIDEATTIAGQRIVRSAGHMTRMIEQLLDFTRIRLAGGLPVERTRVDLAELCRRIISDVALARPDRAIEIRVVGDVVGFWDPDRTWQLLSNLAINAVDHGSQVEPASIVVDGTHPGSVVVRVGNAGAVPPALVPVIFEAFGRPEITATTREVPAQKAGLGLGLFIAQEIVVAHGGTISLDSDATRTTFTVSLPRRVAAHG